MFKLKNNKPLKSIIALVSILFVLAFQVMMVQAIEIPTAPSQPTPPPAPIISTVTTPPAPPPAPVKEQTSETSTKKESSKISDPVSSPVVSSGTPQATNQTTAQTTSQTPAQDALTQATTQVSASPSPSLSPSSGVVGDTKLQTGSATNTAAVTTANNSNIAAADSSTPSVQNSTSQPSATVANIQNGASSNNTSSAQLSSETNRIQTNKAEVATNIVQDTTTGKNIASKNVGNSSITTGDANTTATAITAVNTNAAAISISEFNIADDYKGDIILDFAKNCIVNCGSNTTLTNTQNGANSLNNAALSSQVDNTTFQTNDASLGSNMTLAANSGDNLAMQNTGGDSNITTGDANVSANMLTLANNNLAGNIIYGVVNIFGNLVGDIILPESLLPQPSTTAANTQNGVDSQNNASLSQSINDTTFQNNDASIQNNLVLAANTGDNTASKNTDGNSIVQSGDSSTTAQVLNIANSNIDGGNWWLVIVNKAGQWVGQILGAPQGASYAGSNGTQFTVSPSGEITAVNSGNGAGSINNTSLSSTQSNTISQDNKANIVNNLNLSANTGDNITSKNTGGDSKIKTGDANIIASLVNFVNNNIVGDGKLVVTVVNVFGSWIGDFVTPGQKKEPKPSPSAAASAQQSPAQTSADTSAKAQGSSTQGVENASTISSGTSLESTPDNHNLTQDIQTVLSSLPVSNPLSSSVKTIQPRVISQVAGFKSEVQAFSNDPLNALSAAGNNTEKVLRVNLAWVLLALPILAGLFLIIRNWAKIQYLFQKIRP